MPEEIAQIYQQDGADLNAAMLAYEQSGEWYEAEDAKACVQSFCLVRLVLKWSAQDRECHVQGGCGSGSATGSIPQSDSAI